MIMVILFIINLFINLQIILLVDIYKSCDAINTADFIKARKQQVSDVLHKMQGTYSVFYVYKEC